MLDTAWIYQNQTPDGVTHFNESLVGRALEKFGRDKFGALCRLLHISSTLSLTLNDGLSRRNQIHAVAHGRRRHTCRHQAATVRVSRAAPVRARGSLLHAPGVRQGGHRGRCPQLEAAPGAALAARRVAVAIRDATSPTERGAHQARRTERGHSSRAQAVPRHNSSDCRSDRMEHRHQGRGGRRSQCNAFVPPQFSPC
jgi:hypothetical protein